MEGVNLHGNINCVMYMSVHMHVDYMYTYTSVHGSFLLEYALNLASSPGLPLYPPYYNVEKIMRGKFMQS